MPISLGYPICPAMFGNGAEMCVRMTSVRSLPMVNRISDRAATGDFAAAAITTGTCTVVSGGDMEFSMTRTTGASVFDLFLLNLP